MSSILGIIAGAAIGATAFAVSTIPPIQRVFYYGANKNWPNRLIEPTDAVAARMRGIISKKEYFEIFQANGFDKNRAEQYFKLSLRLLDASMYLRLKWRKEISEKDYYKYMKEIGIDKEQADLYEKVNMYYPPATDLITWQAHEVYEPDEIKKYGLEDELDLVLKEPFYKQGITDEQIKNYWVAHWVHPDWYRIREMLWRGLLTKKDVYEWFRLVEIPPYWRDKLITVAYTPYTRVDVRRMYRLGVLKQKDLVKAYMDIGYDEEHAKNLAAFTVLDAMPAERDLTRTMVEKAYEAGEMTKEEAIEYLEYLGYDKNEAKLIIELKEIKIADEELDDKVDVILTQFRNGLITQDMALAKLDKLNLTGTYRDKVMAKILRKKEKEFKLPSIATLTRWAKSELINIEQYKSYLNRLGYQDPEIAIYVKEVQKVLEARKKFREEWEKEVARRGEV